MQALRMRQHHGGQQQQQHPAGSFSRRATRGHVAVFPGSARVLGDKKCAVKVSAQKDGYKVVVVGGGSAGATVAAHYARKLPGQVAVIDPSNVHYYQPLWTLVGGGFKDVSESARPMADVLPREGAEWLHTAVAEFDPDSSQVRTTDGRTVKYEWLVVATGLQINWAQVKGLPEALGDGRVVSNMSPRTAPLTAKAVRALREGHAVFTMPKGAVKCPGAGHKVCYIAEDRFRRNGVRGDVKVTLAMAADKIFGVPRYAETISRLVAARGIGVELRHNLVEVRAAAREAVFEELAPGGGPPTGAAKVLKYDLLHVTPPQGPLKVVAASPLANAEGWVDVDTKTLQHSRYANVYALGDCAALPTSKTAAAAAAQFLVVRDQLDAAMRGAGAASTAYDGYTCCPLITKEGATMMMEFGYDGRILETFTPLGVVDQSKDDRLMWHVKKDALPWAYWNLMTKGYVPWGEYKNALKRAAAMRRRLVRGGKKGDGDDGDEPAVVSTR